MAVWFEYELAVSGETLEVGVRFYTSEAAVNPIITDTWTYVLTKEPVTVKVLKDRLYNRVREIESGLERWNAISGALSAGQNTRLKAEDVVGG